MLPREKLQQYGIKSLSDDELIALILGKGNRRESVFVCAQRILQQFNHDELINLHDVSSFMKNFNLGFAQSTQLIAAFEIGKRFFGQQSHLYLRTSQQVYQHVQSMENLQKEHTVGLYLDTHFKLIHQETISIGGLNSNAIHPREVFRPALEHNAYAIILVHNHPSGDPTPSEADQLTTAKLMDVAELLGIPLLDHLIIGKNAYKRVEKTAILC